ncbi:hypothetical protein RHMOL_Rhmol08G0098100 [Rhododendron molle]|uniref:Uncharacterized protein n=1 Tax=Rhododendron molle TaxID=49168 RepID=A0ACC0MLI4_RHOML|nr:hypothetical protein RHMOL_Rhmol08G0098100 [Rhododendron molle]
MRVWLHSVRCLFFGVKNFRLRSSNNSVMAPPILSLALPSKTGRVLSIQSHTVQGYVGNKSAVFPLQLLGYDVDPINSVQFSNHTGKMLISLHLNSLRPDIWFKGYPTFKGQVLDGQQLWELIEGLEANDLLFYTHLLTGYIGSVSFLNTVLEVVSKLRAVNPKLTYVCDPVMGDEGKLYVPPELVTVYREKVVPVASMLTPNQFEAEQLTGLRCIIPNLLNNSVIQSFLLLRGILKDSQIPSPPDMIDAAMNVVITSINIDGHLLLIGSHQKEMGKSPEQFRIAIPKIPAYFTKYPDNLDKAAEIAVSSLQALLQRTLSDYKMVGYDPESSSLEIRLIQSQDDIRHPQVKYMAERYS